MQQETIFALSSGPGIGGVAVIRVSGPGAGTALRALSARELPPVRRASLRGLYSPQSGQKLDDALVLWFKAPGSFTGEDCAELHVHGGRAVVEGVLEALAELEGCRPAEAGEFSRRAFDNGKLDLAEIEGLADLIHAQTAAQRTLALRQLGGELSAVYEGWRARLVKYLGFLEADIDFPDEDLPDGISADVKTQVTEIKEEIEKHLGDAKRGILLREGLRIVILGAPNAGKSTLLNHIAKSEVAIVSEEAGTTRDVMDVQLDLGGFPVRLIDTAGIRGGELGIVEAEGIRRAAARAAEADIRLLLVRADEWPVIEADLRRYLVAGTIVVVSQVDRVEMFHVKHGAPELPEDLPVLPISVKSGEGLDVLLTILEGEAERLMGQWEAPALTRLRHKIALEDCLQSIARFEDHAGLDSVLAAEDLRLAVRAIGRITGRVGVVDILDVVFAEFCIGK